MHRMRGQSSGNAYASVVLAVFVAVVFARASAGATLDEIQACLAANVPKSSSALTLKLVSQHRGGSESRHEGVIRWRRSDAGRSETLICMSAPPAVRGLAYLIAEGESDFDLWGYLPEEHRVTQIHASGAARRARIARTAIGYYDLRYLPLNLSSAAPLPPRESRVGERDAFVVELALPPGDDPVYERIVSFLDRESCVPLRIELYAAEDRLLKIVTADPDLILPTNGIHVARSLTIEDLKNEVKTALRVEKIDVDAELPDEIFDPNRLDKNICGRRE
jgi:hypothetical protein